MPETSAITPARDSGAASAESGAEPAARGKTTTQDAVASVTSQVVTTPEMNTPASTEALDGRHVQSQATTPEVAVRTKRSPQPAWLHECRGCRAASREAELITAAALPHPDRDSP